MKTKKIDINNKYYVKINYIENKSLYTLKDTKEDKTICESFNGESFLLKVNKNEVFISLSRFSVISESRFLR